MLLLIGMGVLLLAGFVTVATFERALRAALG